MRAFAHKADARQRPLRALPRFWSDTSSDRAPEALQDHGQGALRASLTRCRATRPYAIPPGTLDRESCQGVRRLSKGWPGPSHDLIWSAALPRFIRLQESEMAVWPMAVLT